MKRYYLIFLIVLFVACNHNRDDQFKESKQEEIIIEGELVNGKDRLVTLDLMGSTAFIPIDSVRCDNKGRFKLSFPGEGTNFYSVKYTDNGYVTIIAKPGDHINIQGFANSIYPYTVEGSEASQLVSLLAESHKKVLDQLQDISLESEEILGDINYVEKKQILMEKFDSITLAFHNFSKDFILNNPKSPAILIALYNQFGPGLPVFHPLTDLEIYQFADSNLYANYSENEAVKALHSQLSAALQQLRNQQKDLSLEIGDKAPDFVLEELSGKSIALSDLSGKYVLLQIWASWSKPSVEENRFLKECIKKFNADSFSILQISIDSDRDAWEEAIPQKYPNWYHLSDLNRWESLIVNLYRIERIPANFLISPSGKIIEMDKFGNELIQTIQKYIN